MLVEKSRFPFEVETNYIDKVYQKIISDSLRRLIYCLDNQILACTPIITSVGVVRDRRKLFVVIMRKKNV